MRVRSVISILLILTVSACVDRINFDVEVKSNFPIVIDGHISDQAGPYTIKVSNSFDIDSKTTMKTPASVKELVILDDLGNREVLSEVNEGTYQTSANGMRGEVGRAYRLRVELFTGQVYESKSDTIPSPGNLDSVYYKFEKGEVGELGETKYVFDIYFDASNGLSGNFYFVWKFTGTFKVVTTPEADKEGEPCSVQTIDCRGCSVCNRVWKCSGIRNIGTPAEPKYVRLFPCSCCTCWYNIFNEKPILSDIQFSKFGKYNAVKAGTVPVDDRIFQHKVYAEVSQLSLTPRAYGYYNAIKDQEEAVNSLFQPISGKIASNFIQVSGPENPIEGLFFAASASNKTIIITRKDVPQRTFEFLPEYPPPIFAKNCIYLFPNSTTIRPAFWED